MNKNPDQFTMCILTLLQFEPNLVWGSNIEIILRQIQYIQNYINCFIWFRNSINVYEINELILKLINLIIIILI